MPHNSPHLSATQTYLLLIAYLIPFFMGISMFFALVLQKAKSKSHKILKYVFLVMSGSVLLYINKFFFEFSLYDHPILVYHNMIYGVMAAPVIFFYYVALLCPWRLTPRFIVLNFAPGIAFMLASTVLMLIGISQPQFYMEWEVLLGNLHQPTNIMVLLMLATYVIQRLYYIADILHMLHVHRQGIKNEYSYTEGINLAWAYWALLAYICYTYTPLLVSVFEDIELPLQLVFIALVTISMLILFFAGYNQPALYADEQKWRADNETKYIGSLANDSKERIHADLLELFNVKKRYREANLTIDDIAKDLNTNRTYVSRVINEDFGMNFYAFVNKFRMKEFMHRLQTDGASSSFKIREVSEQVGFKSYSSFYNFFKEQMGVTPSEYLRKKMRTHT